MNFKHNHILLAKKMNKRQTEPALIEQETVHIAETISEIHPDDPGRHKDPDPEIAAKLFFFCFRRSFCRY